MNRAEIARLLPEVFRRTLHAGSPADAFLGAMEQMHAPAEAALERLEETFNPYRAPDRFLYMLASWVDITRFMREAPPSVPEGVEDQDLLSTGNGRLREAIAAAIELSQWRGTARGLQRFLELVTGIPGYSIIEHVPSAGNGARPFHIRVVAPPQASAHESLFRRVVDQEKPAYVTFDLVFEELD